MLSSHILVKAVAEDLTSVLEGNVTASGDMFREIFEIFVKAL
jgi:hypothetical protein